MESSYNVCFVLLLVAGFFITNGDTIKCFQCTSASDPGCSDLKQNDTHSKYYKECPDSYGLKPFFCRKTYLQLLDTGVTRISRSCGTIINKKNETNCYRADTDYKAEVSCQCFKDACNSVLQIKPTLLSPMITILAAVASVYYENI